jgi:outer membrane PBP1 activator LpoA protein
MPRLIILVLGIALSLSAAPVSSADPGAAAVQALAASEAAMSIGDDRLAETWLSRIPTGSLDLDQMARAQLVRADILIRRGQPMVALQSLPSDSSRVPQSAARIEELRSRALFLIGDSVGAVRARVLREQYLGADSRAIADNRDALWNGLLQFPTAPNDVGRIAAQDSVTRGWLELFETWRQGSAGDFGIWSARYPSHPGNQRIASLRASAPPTSSAGASTSAQWVSSAPLQLLPALGGGRSLALLLPLSGPYLAAGEAVRDGFTAAARQAGFTYGVRIYDTGATANQAVEAYQQAVADGAGAIVGPLHKDAAGAIARLGTPPSPLLALNSLDPYVAAPANFLQFGLAPEDEARAAAHYALAQNRRRALALTPDSEWGRRVLAAFSAYFSAQGGTLVAAQPFESGSPDPSEQVKKLMGVDLSETRHKALTAVLGKNTEFEARRREDIDVIFVAAKPSDSRILLPQLRFYRASSLPIVSTSLINEGQRIEWQRLAVCDMPWMLELQGPWAQTRGAVQQEYPATMRDYPRLVALGGDAFRVSERLLSGALRSGDRIDGATGQLVVSGDGRIARDLSCAPPPAASVAAAAP